MADLNSKQEDPKMIARQEAKVKVRALLDVFPSDTPDEFVLYGYVSHRLTLGDLKRVLAG